MRIKIFFIKVLSILVLKAGGDGQHLTAIESENEDHLESRKHS